MTGMGLGMAIISWGMPPSADTGPGDGGAGFSSRTEPWRLLVKNGLARTHGIGRITPDGTPRDEMVEALRDLEISAMLKRAGIWSEGDPDRIAAFRETQRSEDRELKELQNQVKSSRSAPGFTRP